MPTISEALADVITHCLASAYSSSCGEPDSGVVEEALASLTALLPCMSSGEFLGSRSVGPLLEVVARGLPSPAAAPPPAGAVGPDAAVAAVQVLVEVVRRRFVQPADKGVVVALGMRVFSVLEVGEPALASP